MLRIQKGPQGSPAVRRGHGKAACSPFPNQRSARQRPDDSHRPVRPATKHRGVGSSPAFRRSVPSCGLCGSLSSAALPSLRTSDFLLNSDTDVILSWMQRDVNGQKQRIGKRQDAARVLPDWQRPCRRYVRRLPAIRRTMPLRHLGTRMHTILTRILSPPACVEQCPAGAHQRCARDRRPGPAGNTQQQQQQPCADECPAHKPPAAVIRRTSAPGRMLTALVLYLPHDDPPDSLADYALPRGIMCTRA